MLQGMTPEAACVIKH